MGNSEERYVEVDDLFATRFAEGLTPGLVWGVVHHGEVVHSGALGSVSMERDEAPTTDSVFRIASMSKSFTAAAVLLLRDRDALALDDPVRRYVPEVADPAISVRSLLTMSAGLLSDDPWADRHESLRYDEFGALLADGFTVGRTPGIAFEYSNLGYALLGRAVANITGNDLAFVETELIAPLGMTSTRYHAEQVGPALVQGHVKRSRGWERVDSVAPGSFSAMGGLHSSVGDIATWINGFTQAFRPEPDGHPLGKASRREMQQLQRFSSVDAMLGGADGLRARGTGYGLGLYVTHDSRLGYFVHHPGGYPGYGSRMIWHPDSGLGVVTFSNATYAAAYDQAEEALRLLVRARGVPTPRPVLPITRDWVATVTARLAVFDPDQPWVDDDAMAGNVALDTPDHERRDALVQARAMVGAPLPVDPTALDVSGRTMAGAAWVVPAERGRYEIEILLTPEARPRLQTVTISAVGRAPAGALDRVTDAVADTRTGSSAMLVRALGEPQVLPEPMVTGDTGTEFLVRAGLTWWKAAVTPAAVAFDPYPASAYPRLIWLARQLGDEVMRSSATE